MGVALLAAASFVVMSLWNWLAPSMFGRPEINLLQAAALLVLCRILFGGLRGYGGMHWRQRLAQRWEAMSPEERERFQAGMRGRCGWHGAGGSQTDKPASTA